MLTLIVDCARNEVSPGSEDSRDWELDVLEMYDDGTGGLPVHDGATPAVPEKARPPWPPPGVQTWI